MWSTSGMPKIVVSSVHGSAAGAGMGLAFVTDLCIAAEDARFTPAYAKIGVSPDGGSTVGIVGTVGTRRALQIFLAEDSFSAQQALEWGLVAKVVPATELKAATRQFAERLKEPRDIRNGFLTLPDKPGLSVEIDRKVLAELTA